MNFTADWFSGNIPEWERRLVQFRDKPVRFLEVGSHEGRSAAWLFQNVLTHPESRLETVDCQYQPCFDANMAELGLAATRLVKHTGLSMELVPNLPAYAYDFVYVDGSHEPTHVMVDLINALRCLKDGAWMVADDYPPTKAAVDGFKAVLEASKRHALFEPGSGGWQMWIQKLNHFPHWNG